MLSKVTSKGQVTIPASIRKEHNIQVGDKVDFIVRKDGIILLPVKTLRDFRGTVAGGGEPEMERKAAKHAVVRRITGEMS